MIQCPQITHNLELIGLLNSGATHGRRSTVFDQIRLPEWHQRGFHLEYGAPIHQCAHCLHQLVGNSWLIERSKEVRSAKILKTRSILVNSNNILT